ncbi:RES domain-containing protein [Duganella sp. FT135W]|uniref:RES domain-containing protein n=1 Tax=Duganella flavida TaxID=2692175 RepID=A0A6L8KAT1_9BURK|nr:RES family NAD+ phosphorylase [Duganella flavida]MYM22984.1 RES domain-containing protein [Duganella flavida]
MTRTYRYGPPLSFETATGFPFYWIYAADQTHTAVWEAGFCKNPAILPGCFTFDHGAESGLIPSLSFDRTLRLFDLSGVAASRMGIYDAQRDIEYDWCQWFGVELDQMLEEYKGEVHGFAYPSRRHPGARAYAISSRVRDALASGLAVDARQFADTAEYAELLIDPSFVRRDCL